MVAWRGLRAVPTWVLPLVVGIVVLLLPLVGLDFSTSRQISLACILALMVSGLNLSLGFAGELALGQAAMYAAGAYAAGLLSKAGMTGIVVELLVGGLVALVVGLITGIPGLRLGSWSLAMVSFFLVLLIPDILTIFGDATGGRNGLNGIEPATIFGQPIASNDFYFVIVIVAIGWFVVMRNIVVSRHGVAFRVLKQSTVLASSMGISVFRMKLLAYALGAFPAGLAGALFANIDLFISPEAFGFVLATSVLAASILGGSASVYGALIGAAIMQFGPNQATDFSQYALVFTGAFLIVGGVLLRGGLAQLGKAVVARIDRAAGLKATAAKAESEVGLPPVAGVPLGIDAVSKAFGGNQALSDVSFVADRGRVTALIGPNGSGKTTLLNMVCGFYRTDAGQISVGDTPVGGMKSHRVARTGVSRTFQTPNIPEGVTVLETVASGRYTGHRASILSTVLRTRGFRRVRRDDLGEAERVLRLAGMWELRDEVATSLPLGMRRMLEVARALISSGGVLLLDEAASGLDEDEVQRLATLIRRIRDAGGTILLVEHNFRLVLSLADEIVVLAHGQVMASGTPQQIEHDPRVAKEYLGLSDDDEAAAASSVAELAPTQVEGS